MTEPTIYALRDLVLIYSVAVTLGWYLGILFERGTR